MATVASAGAAYAIQTSASAKRRQEELDAQYQAEQEALRIAQAGQVAVANANMTQNQAQVTTGRQQVVMAWKQSEANKRYHAEREYKRGQELQYLAQVRAQRQQWEAHQQAIREEQARLQAQRAQTSQRVTQKQVSSNNTNPLGQFITGIVQAGTSAVQSLLDRARTVAQERELNSKYARAASELKRLDAEIARREAEIKRINQQNIVAGASLKQIDARNQQAYADQVRNQQQTQHAIAAAELKRLDAESARQAEIQQTQIQQARRSFQRLIAPVVSLGQQVTAQIQRVFSPPPQPPPINLTPSDISLGSLDVDFAIDTLRQDRSLINHNRLLMLQVADSLGEIDKLDPMHQQALRDYLRDAPLMRGDVNLAKLNNLPPHILQDLANAVDAHIFPAPNTPNIFAQVGTAIWSAVGNILVTASQSSQQLVTIAKHKVAIPVTGFLASWFGREGVNARNALTNIVEGFREANPERILKGLTYVATVTIILGTFAFEPIDWAVSSNEVRLALAEGRYQDALMEMGLLMLPGAMANRGDDVVDGATDAIRYSDDVVDASRQMDCVGGICRGLDGVPCSFSADTVVATPNGFVPIVDIRIGDMVYAYHEGYETFGIYPVIDHFSHLDPEITYLTINNEVVETTPNHPFMTDVGWVVAGELQIGDQILSLDGGFDGVQSVETVAQEQVMYNLTVDDAHTFSIGYGQWIVHNDCLSWPPNIPVTPNGRKLADLADYAHENAYFLHTSAIVEVDGMIYVTTNGGASNTIKNDIRNWAEQEGYTYINNDWHMNDLPPGLPSNHAEIFIYDYFDGQDIQVDIIGTSGAPCPACRDFFTNKGDVQIVWNVSGN